MAKKISFWFIAAVVLKQLMWIAFIPLWQFPDEQAHFGQTQNVAEGNPQSPVRSANTSKEIDASERLLGTKRDGFGNNQFTYHPEYNIAYSRTRQGIHEETIRSFSTNLRKELVTNEATVYPPLYYRLTAFFYQVVYPHDLFTRVFTSRLVNIVIFLALVLITYKIGGLVFPRDQLQQLTLVLLVAFHPMLSFVAGGINSDNLFTLVFTFSIYLALKILTHGYGWPEVVMAVVSTVLAILTKPQGPLVLFVYLFPSAILVFRQRTIILLLVLLTATVALGVRRYLLGLFQNHQFLPDIPHFSQLQLSFTEYLEHFQETLWQTYKQTIPWYWGVFRWLSLTYPRVIHRIINWTLVAAVSGIGVRVFTSLKDKKLYSLTTFWFFIYVSVIYGVALITFDYLFQVAHGFPIGLQGRYFFPTVVAHMALLLFGLTTLVPVEFKPILTKCLGVGVVILHTYAFWFVVSSYYTTNSVSTFFLQASQYKPLVFKSPVLEVLVIANIVSIIIFLWYYLRLGAKDEETNTKPGIALL